MQFSPLFQQPPSRAKYLTFLFLGAFVFPWANAARAGTITLSTGPTTTLSGVTNTSVNPPNIVFQVANTPFQSGNSLKLFGDQIFTETSTGSSSVTISLTGTATANSGDFFSIGYKFSLVLTGTGTVTPVLNANGLISGLIPYSAATTLTPATSGTTNYQGVTTSATSPLTASATVNASATFTWAGATAGNTLEINIPSNSIDFAVGTVAIPEPPAGMLLLLAAPLALFLRARFGAAR